MTLKKINEKIESQEFIAEFSVLSGFNSVLSALEDSQTVSELIALLQNNTENQQKVLNRIQHLLPQYETGFIHPHDIPILVYLFALSEVDEPILTNDMRHQLSYTHELWLSRKFNETMLAVSQVEP